MAISDKIADFAGAIEEARGQLADLNGQIGRLEQARYPIVQAAPHTADIVALFQRAVRGSAVDFERRFAEHLKSTFGGNIGAQAVADGRAPNVLRLPAKSTSNDPFNRARELADAPVIDLSALTYFLRDKIEAEIPALVQRLYPDADKGMKAADREKALKELDEQLDELRAKRDAIKADLGAARAAVAPGS